MKRFFKVIASMFAMIAAVETSTASIFFVYQPELPQSKKAH